MALDLALRLVLDELGLALLILIKSPTPTLV
ncbi:hypothetical protein NC653_033854 [Populus alba x Populus x berolinensis]|uniref:Uncharacterized protein n=1 Tax=Populus alba x Populus x berolinensis TaxID=444605 RepID=A0AAD6Q1E2_9ROSI|nr:hypothetical protein NC653_033854 [Populus alba x Populus x berolinensis]